MYEITRCSVVKPHNINLCQHQCPFSICHHRSYESNLNQWEKMLHMFNIYTYIVSFLTGWDHCQMIRVDRQKMDTDQVRAWCLMASNHYLIQCWHTIIMVLRNISKYIFGTHEMHWKVKISRKLFPGINGLTISLSCNDGMHLQFPEGLSTN